MAGVKGKSGRKRNPRNAQRYFNEQFDLNLFDLTDKVIELAKEGNKEMLIYCFDRRMGKPKAQTDIDISGGQKLGSGLVVELFKILTEKQRELESGEPALLEGVKREDE